MSVIVVILEPCWYRRGSILQSYNQIWVFTGSVSLGSPTQLGQASVWMESLSGCICRSNWYNSVSGADDSVLLGEDFIFASQIHVRFWGCGVGLPSQQVRLVSSKGLFSWKTAILFHRQHVGLFPIGRPFIPDGREGFSLPSCRQGLIGFPHYKSVIQSHLTGMWLQNSLLLTLWS